MKTKKNTKTKRKHKKIEIAINKCHGGFSFSHEALQWLCDHGMKSIAVEPNEYFGGKDYTQQLENWRKDKTPWFGPIFSSDEKFVLTNPNDLEDRTNPILIKCIKTLKNKVNTRVSEIKIVSIPAKTKWIIQQYDGSEWIAEEHQTWY